MCSQCYLFKRVVEDEKICSNILDCFFKMTNNLLPCSLVNSAMQELSEGIFMFKHLLEKDEEKRTEAFNKFF